jgi:hypothetical protein
MLIKHYICVIIIFNKLKGVVKLDIMLDIESLGVTPDAVMLTFGAVKFSPFDKIEPHNGIYHRLDADEQIEKGRSVMDDTLAWWLKQSAEAQEEAMGESGRISVISFLAELNRYLVGVDKIWAQGTIFDIIILENMYKMYGQPVPWRYWQIRDSRTLFDLGDDSAKKNNESAHNALADAYFQAISVQDIYQQLNITKKGK